MKAETIERALNAFTIESDSILATRDKMDMEALMAQAAELQNKVASAQEQLGKTKIKGVSENGSCVVDMTGKYEMLNIKIHPTVLAHGADVVAQVVMSAYRDAKQKADELIDKVMGDATAGVPLPQ